MSLYFALLNMSFSYINYINQTIFLIHGRQAINKPELCDLTIVFYRENKNED